MVIFVVTQPPQKKANSSSRPKRLRLAGKLINPRLQTAEVLERLIRIYPEAVCELEHRNPYELIAATILSAQCTDVRVNMVTPKLFAKYPDAESLAIANQTDVEQIVRSTGFYQSKARNLIGMAQRVVEHYDGEIPRDLEDLVTLPGVGRKTGNVVRSVAFDLPGLPVDTHVGRLSRRLGLTTEYDPVKIEMELNEFIPGPERGTFSLRLILHGRRVCDARKPQCQICELADICPSAGKPVTGPTTQRPRRSA
jgi:endonuclease-3